MRVQTLDIQMTCVCSAGSLKGDDVKMKQKLTDEAADGTGSVLSEYADLESAVEAQAAETIVVPVGIAMHFPLFKEQQT